MIFSLTSPKLIDKYVQFSNNSWLYKYQKVYSKNLEKIEDGLQADKNRPNLRILVKVMQMSCIHTSISGFLDVLSYQLVDQFKKLQELNRQKQFSNLDNANNIYFKTFDVLKINYLFQNLGKLQQLVNIFEKCGIRK